MREYVERVSHRRLQFLIDCYGALGLAPERARQWALQTYSVFLGALQIRRDLPAEWPTTDDPAFADYVKFLMVNLLPADCFSPDDDNAGQSAQPDRQTAR